MKRFGQDTPSRSELDDPPEVHHPGRDEQLWYYRSLVDAFRGYVSRMAGELQRVVAEIEVAAFASASAPRGSGDRRLSS